MNERRVNAYVALMCLGALFCLWVADWSTVAGLSVESRWGLAGLIGIALLSESLAIGLSVGGGQSSITFLPLLASVQLFGVESGLLLIVPTMIFADAVVRRKDRIRVVFNAAQVIVGTTVAGAAFHTVNGQALNDTVQNPDITSQLGPFIVFGMVFLAANHAAVSLAITLSQGLPFRRVWHQVLSNSGGQLNDLLIAPLALAVAFLYVQFGIGGILVILLPMLFIRYSYLTTSQLREAIDDLLTALVKAIETRDPYTSGHSQRVSELAGQIAEALGQNQLSVGRIKMAALLHDIGKIEAVYTDILRKPDKLTLDERTVIESHVTRGEQLLRDLASVPDDVVLAVRHHHEREDGMGYPDGLRGPDIPLGAKIIVICDAVDAMLSDRPYRRALPLHVVLEQLTEHSGTQFDRRLVQTLLETNILADFAAMMNTEREASRPEVDTEIPMVTALPVPSLQTPPQPRIRRYQ
ncbi:MAG: HD-GYP domain-containing protein [Gemmatimonadota bacterium]